MNIIKKLAIRKFIKEINPEIKVKFQKWDMECDVYEDTVYVGETFDKRTDKYFMDFVYSIDPECCGSVMMMSLLHEIGHIYTYDEDLSDEKDVLYEVLKLSYTDEQLEEYDKMYFNIPFEKEATIWGIRFAQMNKEIVKKYSKWI